MSDDQSTNYLKALNQHGYSFHQRVIAETANINDSHKGGWSLFGVELPVSVGDKITRIDFVLQYFQQFDSMWLMIAECKRVNPAFGTWCFAKGSYHRPYFLKNTKMMEVLRISETIDSGGYRGDTSDSVYDIGFELKSNSTGDSYPVSNDKDALEKACSQAILGMNGLLNAIQKDSILRKSLGNIKQITIVPVVFTTAKLLASEAELKSSDLLSGELKGTPAVVEKDWLYYQYSQSPNIKHQLDNNKEKMDTWENIIAHEYIRTVAIVNASGIKNFLRAGWVDFY